MTLEERMLAGARIIVANVNEQRACPGVVCRRNGNGDGKHPVCPLSKGCSEYGYNRDRVADAADAYVREHSGLFL